MNGIMKGMKSVFQFKRMVGLFYLANLIIGLLVMFPFKGLLSDYVGHSLVGKSLGSGVSIDFLADITAMNTGGSPMMTGLIFLTSITYWMCMLFFSGGALSILMSGEAYNRTTFWGNSAKYFGRFFRLWLLSIPVFCVFYLVQMIVPLIVRVTYGSDPYEYVKIYSNAIRMGIGYLAIICYYLVFDYARMFVIRNDGRHMRIAIFRALRFTFSNIGRTFVVGLVYFLLGIASLFVYNILAGGLTGANVVAVFLVVVLQQLYIVFKSFVKIGLYSSEVEVFSLYAPSEPILETAPASVVETVSSTESAQESSQIDLGTAG